MVSGTGVAFVSGWIQLHNNSRLNLFDTFIALIERLKFPKRALSFVFNQDIVDLDLKDLVEYLEDFD